VPSEELARIKWPRAVLLLPVGLAGGLAAVTGGRDYSLPFSFAAALLLALAQQGLP